MKRKLNQQGLKAVWLFINCDEPINSYHDMAASNVPVYDVLSIISVHDVLNVIK